MIRADAIFRISHLLGVNQEVVGRKKEELSDCNNIIGEPEGFSVWGGRTRFSPSVGKNWGLYSVTWPDEHTSLIVVGEKGVQAEEAGVFTDLNNREEDDEVSDLGVAYSSIPNFSSLQVTQDHDPDDGTTMSVGEFEVYLRSLDMDFRNPCHFTKFSYGRYVIGSSYRRWPSWYWDGKIDHPVKYITVPEGMAFRWVEGWAGRLWGVGSKEHPLQIYYGDHDELEIKANQWLSFLEGPKTSRLVAMHAAARNTAFVWGDRGVFLVQTTGTAPIFVGTQMIDGDCDCPAPNSIVRIPGVGFAWMGREGMWLLSGNSVRRIDISYNTSTSSYINKTYDTRTNYRLKDVFGSIPINSQYLCSGFWNEKRGLAIFSYPTQECIPQKEWQNPRAMAWRPVDNTWWLLDQGWQSAVEIVFQGQRQIVGTDHDGYLYLLDSNIAYDKLSTPQQWHAEMATQGDPARTLKYYSAILERPFSGTDSVAVSFWAKHQATPITDKFSLSESFDSQALEKHSYLSVAASPGDMSITVQDAAGWDDSGFVRIGDTENRAYTRSGNGLTLETPLTSSYTAGALVQIKAYDPGGPNDRGISPDPIAASRIPVRLTGKFLNIRLSNQYTKEDGSMDYYNGPKVPMTSLTIMAKTIGIG